MQFARTPVIIQAVGGVRLLLRLDDDRPRSERVHCAARDINHVARIDVDPVENFFGALLVNRFFQLRRGYTFFQAQSNLRAGLGMGDVPALRLAPRLAHAQSLRIIGVNLHRKFFVRKEKLKQQRKALRIAGRISYEFARELLGQVRQSLASKRTICDFAVVSAKPGLANLLLEPVIGIDRRQILRTPRTRVESRKHQKWIKISHIKTAAHKKDRSQMERPLPNLIISSLEEKTTARQKTFSCAPGRDRVPPSK